MWCIVITCINFFNFNNLLLVKVYFHVISFVYCFKYVTICIDYKLQIVLDFLCISFL